MTLRTAQDIPDWKKQVTIPGVATFSPHDVIAISDIPQDRFISGCATRVTFWDVEAKRSSTIQCSDTANSFWRLCEQLSPGLPFVSFAQPNPYNSHNPEQTVVNAKWVKAVTPQPGSSLVRIELRKAESLIFQGDAALFSRQIDSALKRYQSLEVERSSLNAAFTSLAPEQMRVGGIYLVATTSGEVGFAQLTTILGRERSVFAMRWTDCDANRALNLCGVFALSARNPLGGFSRIRAEVTPGVTPAM